MTDFFEFEKKGSDGIRRRGSPQKRASSLAHAGGQSVLRNAEEHHEVLRAVSPDEIQEESRELRGEDSLKKFVPSARSTSEEEPVLTLSETIKKKKKIRPLVWGVVLSVGVLALAGTILSFSFSRLTVTLTPASHAHEVSKVKVILDHAVLQTFPESSTIPAERLEFTRTEKVTFQASGQKYVEERARGIAKIYNRMSASPQRLLAHTRFVTKSGAVYRLPQAITVPGAAVERGAITPRFIEAELVADKAGSEQNSAGELTLTIPGFLDTPKYEGFYAIASAGFQGGFTGDSKVATREDIKRAEEGVTKKVFDAIKLDIAKKTPPDFKVIEGLGEIEILSVVSPRENAAGDEFGVEASAVGRILIFRESDIVRVLEHALLQDNDDQEHIAEKDLGNIRYGIKDMDFAKGKAEIILEGTVAARSLLSKQEFASLLQGQGQERLQEMLRARKDISDFTLRMFPPWTSRAPEDDSRIRVLIQE